MAGPLGNLKYTATAARGCLCSLFLTVPILFAFTPAYADDWPMAFHDSRHTGQSSEIVTPPLTLAWTWKDNLPYDNGAGTDIIPMGFFWLPIYYQGNVYIQGGNNADRVFCLNPATGALVWQWSNPNYAQAGTYLFQFNNYPGALNGRIVNATSDFTTTIDAATGSGPQMTYNTNGGWPSGGAAIWNGMAYLQYVRSDDDTESFQVVQDPVNWVLASPSAYVAPNGLTSFTDSSFRVPAVDNYTAYVNLLGQLNAINATTGWQIWTYGQMDFASSPAESEGIVYFYAADQQQMMALNVSAVTFPEGVAQVPVLWSVPLPLAYSPIVSGGLVYVGADDGSFYALNAATGAVQWSFQTAYPFTALQIPAVSGSLIYVPGPDGNLYALDKNTGAEVWHYTGTAAWGPVVVAGGMVFASDLTNTFYAFQPQSAAVGPSVTGLSTTYAPNNSAISVNLSGSGFYAGGTSSAVESIYLDNAAGTKLNGYTVTNDQTITGVLIPNGIAPGTYHIKVQTTVATSANEPTFTVEAANTIAISTLGYSSGPNALGTGPAVQRHLATTAGGTLVAVYIGPASGETQYPSYNFSLNGGLTWSGQGQLFLSNEGSVIYAPTSSIWFDSEGQLNISSVQWPSYNETFQKFATNDLGVLTQDSGFPIYPSGGSYKNAVLTPGIPGPVVTEPGSRVWVVYQQGSAGGTGPVLAYYSDDGGVSWTATAQINQAPGTQPALVLYQSYPAVLYSDGGSLAWSAWNGQSWSAPQILPGPITGVGGSLSAAVTASGQVGVAYSPANGGVYYTGYSGQGWSSAGVLDAAGSSPSLTTDGQTFYVFYTNASGNLVYRQTLNGVWNAPVAITTDGNQNTAAATLALSPAGQIPVIWTAGTAASGYLVKAAVIGGPANVVSAAPGPSPALAIGKANSGNFNQGQTGATYTITVSNATSAGASAGAVTVTDTEPAGLTLVSLSGTGWSCTGATCTRSDPLTGGASYPLVTASVNVATNAPPTVNSQATVSGGGSASATASDVTTIAAVTPPPCTLSYPAGISLANSVSGSSTPATQSFSITVTPSAACNSPISWTATSSASAYWLSIDSGSSGNGTGAFTIEGSALSNTELTPRAASIAITPSIGAAFSVPITQQAVAASTPAIDLEVTALYQTTLGRDPDATGYAFWTGSGLNGLGQMLDSFLTSSESFNTNLAVLAAYQAATGSAASYSQFRTATDAIHAGTLTIASLFTSLTGSGYSASTLYQNLLGRVPTAAETNEANVTGLALWFENLIGYPASSSPVSAANNEFQSTGTFANSASANGDHTNAMFIRMLYFTTLLRDPDAAGFAYWLGVANGGGAGILFQGAAAMNIRLEIEGGGSGGGFAGSHEFQSLF